MEERRKEDNGSVLFRSPPPPPPSLLQNYLKMEEDEWVGGHSRRLDSWAKEEGMGGEGMCPISSHLHSNQLGQNGLGHQSAN
jgi:hypothetical protein